LTPELSFAAILVQNRFFSFHQTGFTGLSGFCKCVEGESKISLTEALHTMKQ
jgi:hypothetical protein